MTCSRWRRLATTLSPPGSGALLSSTSHRGISSSSSSSRRNNSPSSWPQLRRKETSNDFAKDSIAPSDASLPFAAAPFSIGQLARRKPAARDPVLSSSSTHDDAPVPAATPIAAVDEAPTPLVSKSDRSRTMLIARGLSSSLKASDFHRLVPNELSSWNVLKRVQQKRCPKTFEPLGVYYLTFTSPVALGVYRDKLLRLHRLNRHRLRFNNDLLRDEWLHSVPPHLSAGSSGDLVADAESFTLAPGSLDIPAPASKRAGVPNSWWAKILGARVQQFGRGASPPAVLLHLHPPTLTAQQLAQAIEEDGGRRGHPWNVHEPLPLDEDTRNSAQSLDQLADQGSGFGTHSEVDVSTTQDEGHDDGSKPASGDPSSFDEGELESEIEGELEPAERYKARPPINYGTQGRQRSRFVIVCADEPEAQRFYRHWNQKILTASEHNKAEQNLVHASRINW